MQCSSPPPLTDNQITAALDGEADRSVLAHLEHCPSCVARLADARRFEQRAQQLLYRWDCPSPQQLGDYHLGLVAPEDERAVRRHLAQCARCAEELEELRRFLVDGELAQAHTPPAPRLRPSIGRLVARMLPRSPALAMRGAGAGPFMAEADGTTILIDVLTDAARQITLRCQLVSDDQERWTGALAELRQAGALRATAVVDDLGGFSCGPLVAGTAELRVTPERGRMLVLEAIDLTASG